MRHHPFWMGASTLLLLAAACSDSTGPHVDKLQQALAQSRVSLSESVRAGESSVSGGMAVRAALLVDAAPEYSIGALGSGTLHDVRVDIVSGSVTSSHVVGAGADPCPGSIPLADAIAIAEGRAKGSAVKVQPDDDDQCLREVQVLSGTTLWEVKLDRDGTVLEVEKADGDGN